MSTPSRWCWHCGQPLEPDRHHVVEEETSGVRHFVHAACAPKTGLRLVAKWKRRARKAAPVQPKRDHGCYSQRFDPCVGYVGSGCRHCGRIITLDLVERGDAVGG